MQFGEFRTAEVGLRNPNGVLLGIPAHFAIVVPISA